MHYSKVIAVFSLLFIGVLSGSAQNCGRISKREMVGMLGGFYYDASRITAIPHDKRPLRVQFEVSLFSASVYNLVWYVPDMPPRTTIKVYEVGETKGKKTIVFDSATATLIKENRYTYEVRDGKHKRLVVEYEVPGQSNVGCIFFILGFRGSDSVAKKGRHYVIK
jgi:hypothetical protein